MGTHVVAAKPIWARAMAPPKAPKLPLCRLFRDTCKISEIGLFPKPFCRP